MHTWQRQKRTGDRFALATALFMVLLTSAVPTRAATTTAQFLVQAQVDVNCRVASTSSVNFGLVGSPVDGDDTGVGELVLSGDCFPIPGQYPSISLSKGTGVGSTFAQRKMTSTTNSNDTLTYSLYSSSPSSSGKPWGDGTEGSELNLFPARTSIIYGVIRSQSPPQGAGTQAPPPGTYTDTVVITVTF